MSGKPTGSGKAQAAADEYVALLERHGIKRDIDFVRQAKSRGVELDPATLSRIRNAKAKSEPDAETLRKIAAAFGLGRAEAFPSSTDVTVSGAVGVDADPYWVELRAIVERLTQIDRARLLERAHSILEQRGSSGLIVVDGQPARLAVSAKAEQVLADSPEKDRSSSKRERSPTPKRAK